jgi:hypothetical protein
MLKFTKIQQKMQQEMQQEQARRLKLLFSKPAHHRHPSDSYRKEIISDLEIMTEEFIKTNCKNHLRYQKARELDTFKKVELEPCRILSRLPKHC